MIRRRQRHGLTSRSVVYSHNTMRAPTPRQQEVLLLVAHGLTNQDIADRLGVAVETVKSHVKRILERMDARSRAHAVWLGVLHGWLETGSPDNSRSPSPRFLRTSGTQWSESPVTRLKRAGRG